MPQFSVRKPSGHYEIVDPEGPTVRGDTVCCVHCKHTWLFIPGSGRLRGWCHRCGGLTCGSPACDLCVPFEARLENLEAGRPELTPPPTLVVNPGLSE